MGKGEKGLYKKILRYYTNTNVEASETKKPRNRKGAWEGSERNFEVFFVFSKHVGRIKRTRNKVLTTHTNKDSDFSTV